MQRHDEREDRGASVHTVIERNVRPDDVLIVWNIVEDICAIAYRADQPQPTKIEDPVDDRSRLEGAQH